MGKVIRIFSILSVVMLVSCSRQSSQMVHETVSKKPLFIEMPQSAFTFEDIGSVFYTALLKQFRRKGYWIVDTVEASDYSLSLVINDVSPRRRYISPDVLLFNYSLKCDVTCILKDNSSKIIQKKTFSSARLVSKAKSPILNSSFIEYEIEKLCLQSVPQIELFFRSFLCELK